MFFALHPENAIIADSNPELINLYRQVAGHVDDVIAYLEKYENTPERFYSVRGQEWLALPEAEAAARTIFLNRLASTACTGSIGGTIQRALWEIQNPKFVTGKACMPQLKP